MAKLTAPLLSFDARGQLAKTLVYSGWKGIKDVRSYVIPANPRTGPQQTQRGYFADGVLVWHTDPMDAEDKLAWNRYAPVLSKPQSGFNAFTAAYINNRVLGLYSWRTAVNGGFTDNGGGSFDATIKFGALVANAVTIHWGYTPTSLINESLMGAGIAGVYTLAAIPGTPNSRIYMRFTLDGAASAGDAGASGIYLVELGP